MKLFIIFAIAIFLNAQTIEMNYKPIPKLSKDEKRFKDFTLYKWKDFHLGWKVKYFDVVSFSTKAFSDGKHFKLHKDMNLTEVFHIGKKRKIFDKTFAKSLAKVIMKPDYFWKQGVPLIFCYNFYSLRFIDANDGILKAIETLDEVRQFLGKIDTEAEFNLWIMASEKYKKAYSYKKIDKTYRVRFFNSDDGECYFNEYFYFYDENGKVIKKQNIREVHIKRCIEALS